MDRSRVSSKRSKDLFAFIMICVNSSKIFEEIFLKKLKTNNQQSQYVTEFVIDQYDQAICMDTGVYSYEM